MARVCQNNHVIFGPDDEYVNPGTGAVECRQCRRDRHQTHSENRKALRKAARAEREAQEALPALEIRGPRRKSRRALAGQRRGLRAVTYSASAVELEVLQLIADGLTPEEIAVHLYISTSSVRQRLHRLRAKYGANSTVAAVAQGLKKGTLRPDKRTAKTLRGTRRVERSVIAAYVGYVISENIPTQERAPSEPVLKERQVIHAATDAHAVSILWAAGYITSRHVPQTKNLHRLRKQKS